jgi:hypothetical protein
MPLARIIAAVLAALFTSGALTKDIDEGAVRNGYQRLPPLSPEKGGSGAEDPANVYVKVIETRRKLSIVDTGANIKQPKASYSIVSFEIDCSKVAMRYRSAQLLDPPWNPKGSNVPVQGPWHTPAKDSVPERALNFACKT